MKKFLAIAASAVLATSAFAFAACGGDNGGVVNGDYKEPTSTELSTAIADVDTEKVFEELTGFELDVNLSGSYSANGTSADGSAKLGYKLVLTEEAIAGKGDVSLKYNMTSGGTTTNGDYSATIYNDEDYAYAEIKGLPATIAPEGAFKAKLEYMSLVEDIIGQLPIAADTGSISSPNLPDDSDSDTVETVPGDSKLAEALEMLAEYKVKVGLDATNGFKLKISFTEESLWAIIESESRMPDEQIEQMKEAITFNKFVVDIYFALDAEGGFKQFSVNMDIDIFGDGAKLGKAGQNLTLKVNGYIALKAFGGDVALPGNIAEDVTYLDVTDMFGNVGVPGLPFAY